MPAYVGRYFTCMEVIQHIRSTWRKDSEASEVDVLAEFANVPLLVIDEIGMQYGTESEQNHLFDVLDRRYRDMMPTILLTNQNKEPVTFAVTVDSPLPAGVTDIANSATVADDGANGPDPTPGDNTGGDTTPVVATPDLVLGKSDGGASTGPGATALTRRPFAASSCARPAVKLWIAPFVVA